MSIVRINDKISYIKASNNPLSADIGIINTDEISFLYDVGNGINNIEALNSEYNVIISHFHIDHMGNIANIRAKNIYVSKESYRHLPKECLSKSEIIVVDGELVVSGIRIFNVPSSHARGCLGAEIGEYAFVGDATYSSFKNNKLIYNSQLLKEEIELLKSLGAKYLLISHYDSLIRDRKDVINELLEIYSLRNKNSSEIVISR